MDVRDVGVVQRSEHLRFALKSREALWIVGEEIRKNFDRDVAIERRVARAIHLSHTAGAERGENVVRAEASAGLKGQRSIWVGLYPSGFGHLRN